ncbi:MAG: FG-GAP-like repeat-containing protein [Saprospiraceae bacterium]|nr:FG-GAP-like repeat-containing protein [Saprospiraceae bacterium]
MRISFLFIAIIGWIQLDGQSGFTKVTDANNPITTYTPGALYRGAAWIDVNNDDLLDLFVAPNKLFINGGNKQFTFKDTGFTFDDNVQRPTGISWADVDNDGDLDCAVATTPSQLYMNDGTGAFSKVDLSGNTISGWGCAFGDANNDGWLDLVIAHAIGFIPNPSPSFFFVNNGAGALNLSPQSYDFTTTTAPYTVPYWSDFDLDGDLDLFIASGPGGSPGPDFHYKNLKIETGKDSLVRITDLPFATEQQDGQCYNFIDYDNDGDLDLCLTNYAGAASKFYRNDNGTYTPITTPFTVPGLPRLANSWGDFDNDGDLDVIIANDNFLAPAYYQNNGDGTFSLSNVGIASNVGTACMTSGDFDNDGDLDIHIQGTASGRALYENTSLAGNKNWVNIKCTGSTSNRSAIGAKVRLKATINGNVVWQMREISAQNTFQGQNDLRVHFGLGDATIIDSLVIEYLGGAKDVFTNLMINQFYSTTEKKNDISIITSNKEIARNTLQGFKIYPNPTSTLLTIEQIAPFSGASAIYSIFDGSGKLIQQRILQDSVGQKVPVSLQELPTGQYYIYFKMNEYHQTLTVHKY